MPTTRAPQFCDGGGGAVPPGGVVDWNVRPVLTSAETLGSWMIWLPPT